jgi:hypothetical protein
MAVNYWNLVDKAFDRHVPDFLGLLMVGYPSAWRRCSRSARKAVCATLQNRGIGMRLEIYSNGEQIGVLYNLTTKEAYPHPYPYYRGSGTLVTTIDARTTF